MAVAGTEGQGALEKLSLLRSIVTNMQSLNANIRVLIYGVKRERLRVMVSGEEERGEEGEMGRVKEVEGRSEREE